MRLGGGRNEYENVGVICDNSLGKWKWTEMEWNGMETDGNGNENEIEMDLRIGMTT